MADGIAKGIELDRNRYKTNENMIIDMDHMFTKEIPHLLDSAAKAHTKTRARGPISLD